MEPENRSSVVYHYYRDPKGQPRIVLARVIDTAGHVGYGWAICSKMDQFHKKDYVLEDFEGDHPRRGGCRIARERAWCAIANPRRGVSIGERVWRYKRAIRNPDALQVIQETGAASLIHLVQCNGWGWRSLPEAMFPPQYLADAKGKEKI